MSALRRHIALLLLIGGAASVRADPVTLAIDAGAGTTYDSNLFRLSPLEKRSTGFRSIDDFAVVPQIDGQLSLPLGLQTLSVAGRLARRFYRYNTELDTTETGLAARLQYVLPFDCSGVVAAHQFRRLTSYEDVVGAPRRIAIRERVAEGDALCSITPEVSASVAASASERVNRDPILSAFDLREQSVRGEVAYGLVDTVQLFGAVRYRHREQPNFVSILTPDGDRARIVDAGGGARWSPTEYLSLSGDLNWTTLRETANIRRGDSWTGDAVIDWQATGKTRLRIEASRSIDVSPNIGAIAYEARTVLGRATWEATPRITATFEARYRHRYLIRELDPTGRRLLFRAERDDTLNLDAKVDYRITDALQARIGAGYRDRRANFADLEYRAAVATVGFSYRFAGPPLDVPLE